MSRSLSKPWILDALREILQNTDELCLANKKMDPKVVQVIKCKNQSLTISDGLKCIVVNFSKKCYIKILEEEESLSSLQYCQIKIDQYCFITNNNYEDVAIEIRCNRVYKLGAIDCAVIGSPINANDDKIILSLKKALVYREIVEKLFQYQFQNNDHFSLTDEGFLFINKNNINKKI
jgi:hypothetical protein